MDAALGEHWILSAAAIWQQQYQSAGPDGASAAYMKYSPHSRKNWWESLWQEGLNKENPIKVLNFRFQSLKARYPIDITESIKNIILLRSLTDLNKPWQ